MTASHTRWRLLWVSAFFVLTSCASVEECRTPFAVPAELSVGRSALERGDYSAALVELRAATTAAVGNANAYYAIGRLHEEGLGVPRDQGLAAEWYEIAIRSEDHAKSKFRLAHLTFWRIEEPATGRERWQAREWFRQSFRSLLNQAEQGDSEAQYMLGYSYGWGFGVPIDRAESERWLQRSAEQRHAEAQYTLAMLYSGQIGWGHYKQDRSKALKWLHLAAELGHAGAQYSLGEWYHWGVAGLPRDHVLAYKWYSLAAARGHEAASAALGNLATTMSADQLADARELVPQKCRR